MTKIIFEVNDDEADGGYSACALGPVPAVSSRSLTDHGVQRR